MFPNISCAMSQFCNVPLNRMFGSPKNTKYKILPKVPQEIQKMYFHWL